MNKSKTLPPPPINPCRGNGVSVLSIAVNIKNGWNRFPENAGSCDSRVQMRWTNDDGTVYPDDYKIREGKQ